MGSIVCKCDDLDHLLKRAPELQPLSVKLELERKPYLKIDEIHQQFLRCGLTDLCACYRTGCRIGASPRGNISYAEFVIALGIGETPLLEKSELCHLLIDLIPSHVVRVFKLLDLNESGHIDFLEYLSGCWNLCVLEDNDNVFRFLFQLYAPRGMCTREKVCEMIRDLQGSAFCPKMWLPVKERLETVCPSSKCSWKEFKEVSKLIDSTLFCIMWVMSLMTIFKSLACRSFTRLLLYSCQPSL